MNFLHWKKWFERHLCVCVSVSWSNQLGMQIKLLSKAWKYVFNILNVLIHLRKIYMLTIKILIHVKLWISGKCYVFKYLFSSHKWEFGVLTYFVSFFTRGKVTFLNSRFTAKWEVVRFWTKRKPRTPSLALDHVRISQFLWQLLFLPFVGILNVHI